MIDPAPPMPRQLDDLRHKLNIDDLYSRFIKASVLAAGAPLCQHCWDSFRWPTKVYYLFSGGTGCSAGHKSPDSFSPKTADQAALVEQAFAMYHAEERRLKGGG